MGKRALAQRERHKASVWRHDLSIAFRKVNIYNVKDVWSLSGSGVGNSPEDDGGPLRLSRNDLVRLFLAAE